MKRNLYYYVYPIKGSVWDWNLAEINSYLSSFNGKKILRIAVDERTEPSEKVLSKIDQREWTVLIGDNQPNFGEKAFFIEDIASLESRDPLEMTFRAHAKGVTRNGEMLINVLAWAKAMYRLNLDDIPLIERLMTKHSAVGAFRVDVPSEHHLSKWHYSGSFFWFKHSTLFSNLWRGIANDFWGVEQYLGRHIAMTDSFNFTPGAGANYFNEVSPKECRRWLAKARRGIA